VVEKATPLTQVTAAAGDDNAATGGIVDRSGLLLATDRRSARPSPSGL